MTRGGIFSDEGHGVLRVPVSDINIVYRSLDKSCEREGEKENYVFHWPDVPCDGCQSTGLRAFRSRPASRRQRSDLVTLPHIKEQSRLSLGS